MGNNRSYNPRPTLSLALPLIRKFEGCRLDAYPDPGTGGEPWTIGWGTTRYPDGRPVRRGDYLSQGVADGLLEGEALYWAWLLSFRIPAWHRMREEQRAALLSFAWNVGIGFYGSPGFATITRALREANWSAVPGVFQLYVNPGTPVEAGLRRRRVAEGDLWKRGLSVPQVVP